MGYGAAEALLPRTMCVMGITFEPLTVARWPDFEQLFGDKGACGGCWCMWWRLKRAEFEAQKGAQNKAAMKRLVRGGHTPGLLAYRDDHPVGWCAVEPREQYPRLDRSPALRRIDEQPVWSVGCFFIAADERGRGLSLRLLRASVDHVRREGGRIVEGYPVDADKEMPGPWVWTGLASTFVRAGFKEVARKKPTRPIMRRNLRPRS